MRWTCAAAGLLFLGGCKPNEAPVYPNLKRPPASATCFYLPENAINLHFEQAVDVGYGACSLLTYDVNLQQHANDFVETVRQRLESQGWYPVEWDLQLNEQIKGWKKLPLAQDPTRTSDDELLTQWWVNKKNEAFHFDLFHWCSRTDGGPRYSVRMGYFEQPGAARIVERYRRLHGFPWEPQSTSAPTSRPADLPVEF